MLWLVLKASDIIFFFIFSIKKNDLGSCQICADKQCVHMISQVVSEVSKEKDWKALPSHRLWLRLLKIRLALIAHFDNWSLPNWPIWPSFEVNGLDWQCCLADSSKRAPRILIFTIAMGAEYLSYVKSIATFAPTFYGYRISLNNVLPYIMSSLE